MHCIWYEGTGSGWWTGDAGGDVTWSDSVTTTKLWWAGEGGGGREEKTKTHQLKLVVLIQSGDRRFYG